MLFNKGQVALRCEGVVGEKQLLDGVVQALRKAGAS